MEQISRKGFIRLLVAFTGAAVLGEVGCSDGFAVSGLRVRRDEEDTVEDPSEPAASTKKGSAATNDGGSTNTGGSTDTVDSGGTEPAVTDAGTAPATTTDAGVDAGFDAGINVCQQNLMLAQNAGIVSGHVHSVTIPAADFASTAPRTYTIAGAHTHQITITAAQFATLRAGGTVTVTSTNVNNHTHDCTVKCA